MIRTPCLTLQIRIGQLHREHEHISGGHDEFRVITQILEIQHLFNAQLSSNTCAHGVDHSLLLGSTGIWFVLSKFEHGIDGIIFLCQNKL